MYSVDIYSRVRRACLKDGMSAREAARVFNKDRKTIAKMLRHTLPPGYRRSEAPRRPALDP
jgi:transposase